MSSDKIMISLITSSAAANPFALPDYYFILDPFMPKDTKSPAIFSRKKSSRDKLIGIMIFGAAIIVFILLALRYDFVQDDAYISFRYAANFISGHGLVYNIGERVEGYTNFLWVILLALFKKILGIDFVVSSRILSLFSGAIIYALGLLFIRRIALDNRNTIFLLFVIMMGACPALPYWGISGLETIGFAALSFAALYFEYRKPAVTPIILVLATLTRPEGGLIFGVILIHRIIKRKSFPLMYSLLYLVLLLPYAAFKLYYYGSLIPNPFHAKTGFGLDYIASGFEYFWQFLSTLGIYGLVLLLPLIMIPKLWPQNSLLYLFIGVYLVYVILIGGDVLKVYRFYVPILPPLYFLCAMSLHEMLLAYSSRLRLKSTPRQAIAIFLAAALALSSFLLSKSHVNTFLFAEKGLTGKMQYTAAMLKKYMGDKFSIATSTIGALGYELTGHRVIDMLGLTDPYIARNPETIEGLTSTWKERRFNSRYLLEQQPDFIMFSTNFKPSAPAERALMLHSEFRDKYSPNGFSRPGGVKWTILYVRMGEVVLSEDRVHPDLTFVNKVNEGFSKLARGNAIGCVEDLEAAAANLKEEYALIYFGLGEALARLKKFDSAYTVLNRAIELVPQSWQTRMALAAAAQLKGDKETAERQLTIVKQIAPWVFEN
jgi:hypothetical protein